MSEIEKYYNGEIEVDFEEERDSITWLTNRFNAVERDKRELKKEIERLNSIIKDIETYIHLWNIEEIGEKTMLILNDILLIKNGMRNEVVRLKKNKND